WAGRLPLIFLPCILCAPRIAGLAHPKSPPVISEAVPPSRADIVGHALQRLPCGLPRAVLPGDWQPAMHELARQGHHRPRNIVWMHGDHDRDPIGFGLVLQHVEREPSGWRLV